MLSPGLASLLEETGPFVGSNFLSDPKQREERILNDRILIIGAGGLGCEILKSLAFNGFKHIDIIDMDQIDVSNLNRQFLFRKKDVGRYKSEVAAEYVRNRILGRFPPIKDSQGKDIKEGIEINFKTCKIQELPDEYYEKFDLIIGGLDNIAARFWMSEKLVNISKKKNKCIPYIDGGTTAWSGQITVIFPGHTACLECQKGIWETKQVIYQSCTLVSHPRKPEHCIHYARDVPWVKERKQEFNADNDEHIHWITEKAQAHAKKFNLDFDIDDKLTRRVLKHTVAAIASTQAIIASMCCTEAFKILSDRATFLNNNINTDLDKNPSNMLLYDGNSDYVGVFIRLNKMNRNEDCKVCIFKTPQINFIPDETLGDLIERIKAKFHIPGVNTLVYKPNTDDQQLLICQLWDCEENIGTKTSELDISAGNTLSLESTDNKKLFIDLV